MQFGRCEKVSNNPIIHQWPGIPMILTLLFHLAWRVDVSPRPQDTARPFRAGVESGLQIETASRSITSLAAPHAGSLKSAPAAVRGEEEAMDVDLIPTLLQGVLAASQGGSGAACDLVLRLAADLVREAGVSKCRRSLGV